MGRRFSILLSVGGVSGVSVVTRASGVGMRAPFDPRSVTETFAMYTATAPPEGFTWGYDTRSTTETYKQWLLATSSEPVATAEAITEAVGVPSVSESVQSWYDSGIRIEADEADAVVELAEPVASVQTAPDFTQSTIELTEAQVKAYGGPTVRPLTEAPVKPAPTEAPVEAFTIATPDFTQSTIELTEAQIKAYGGDKVRPLTPVTPAAAAAGVTSWYDAGTRLAVPEVVEAVVEEAATEEVEEAKEWPMVGGSAGYHRMAGRVIKPVVQRTGMVVPTERKVVQSWYDEGLRLLSAQ